MAFEPKEAEDGQEAAYGRRDRLQAKTLDVLTAQRRTIVEAIRQISVTQVTYYRWRSEYGELKSDQVKWLIELEMKNARLRLAYRGLGQHRSTQRKVPKPAEDEAALTADIIALASQYGRHGYRQITALLREAGQVQIGQTVSAVTRGVTREIDRRVSADAGKH